MGQAVNLYLSKQANTEEKYSHGASSPFSKAHNNLPRLKDTAFSSKFMNRELKEVFFKENNCTAWRLYKSPVLV